MPRGGHRLFCGKSSAEGQNPPPRPPAPKPLLTPSACEIHREWIESQVALGRNAMSIYQDLVERHGFTHAYNSVKRFVRSFEGSRARALRRARGIAGRGIPGRLRRGCTDAAAQWQIPPAVFVRDDAQVLREELSQGGVESRPGELGAAARGSVPGIWRFRPIRGAWTI